MTKILLSILFLCCFNSAVFSQEKTINLGFIGSLSSFASSYGTAALEGAQLAVKELKQSGISVNIIVEDDQSIAKHTVNSFIKLSSVDKVQGIIGGSWWINSIVKQAENAKIPIISCETLYNQDTINGQTYFIMQGDLKEWIRIYEPLVNSQNYKRGAIIRYASGFGATLADAMKSLFTQSGRSFVGAIEYNDILIPESAAIILKLKQLKPDVVYIDAQPGGLANLLKRISENGMENMTIFSNSIAEDLLKDKLLDTSKFKNFYYSKRTTFDQDFSNRFEKEYKKKPYLNADLSYYAVYLLVEALKTNDSIAALKSGISVNAKNFTFNEHNVFSGTPQEIWKVEGTNPVKY